MHRRSFADSVILTSAYQIDTSQKKNGADQKRNHGLPFAHRKTQNGLIR